MLDNINNNDQNMRLYAARWFQSNRMYCSMILPFLTILFDVKVKLKDITIDDATETTFVLVPPIDFSRVNYCFQTINTLINFHPKNVLRTFSSNAATDAGFNIPLKDQLGVQPFTFLDYILFISSLYIEALLEDDHPKLLDNLTVKQNACKIISAIFENDRLSISDSVLGFVVYSCTKTLAKQVISDQVYLELPLAQLLIKIFDRKRVDINSRLLKDDPVLSKGN